MSVFLKWILGWLGILVGSLIFVILEERVSTRFSWALYGNVVVWILYLRALTCPQCGAPVHQTADDFHRTPRIMRVPVRIFKMTCHVCERDLTKLD